MTVANPVTLLPQFYNLYNLLLELYEALCVKIWLSENNFCLHKFSHRLNSSQNLLLQYAQVTF